MLFWCLVLENYLIPVWWRVLSGFERTVCWWWNSAAEAGSCFHADCNHRLWDCFGARVGARRPIDVYWRSIVRFMQCPVFFTITLVFFVLWAFCVSQSKVEEAAEDRRLSAHLQRKSPTTVVRHFHICRATDQNSSGWQIICCCRTTDMEQSAGRSAPSWQLCSL